MDSFYTPPDHINPDRLTIEGDEFAHLTHVMRKKAGDLIRVVDGVGSAYDAVVTEIRKNVAVCSIQAHHRRLHEPELDVTLAVGLLKNGSNFDYLVEKTAEIGVNTIIPLLTERTIPRQAKTARWQKLALAAMKQSGRCILPAVRPLTTFSDLMESAQGSPAWKIIPHEKEEGQHILRLRAERKAGPVLVCIGPEGGFTDAEIQRASESGFDPVSLGPRRLRTETAAVVAVTLVFL